MNISISGDRTAQDGMYAAISAQPVIFPGHYLMFLDEPTLLENHYLMTNDSKGKKKKPRAKNNLFSENEP